MPEVWLDASVINHAVDGDRDLELALRMLRLRSTLLIVPKVREELLFGNPLGKKGRLRSPDDVAKTKEFLDKLRVEFDELGSAEVRRQLFEKQFKFKAGKTIQRAIEESDAIILSQVAASAKQRQTTRPTFITTDRRLVDAGDAQSWGIDIKLPDPALVAQAHSRRMILADKLHDLLGQIRRQHELLSGEHQIQANLIYKPSIIGFIGFWVNHMFNTDIPPLEIWNPAFSSLAYADLLVRGGDFAKAAAVLVEARGELLKAAVAYRRWNDGIEKAGVKMQVTIGLVAGALIVAAVGSFAFASAGSSAAAAVDSLANLLVQSDALAVRVATESNGPAAEAALAEWENVLEQTEEWIEQTLSR